MGACTARTRQIPPAATQPQLTGWERKRAFDVLAARRLFLPRHGGQACLRRHRMRVSPASQPHRHHHVNVAWVAVHGKQSWANLVSQAQLYRGLFGHHRHHLQQVA